MNENFGEIVIIVFGFLINIVLVFNFDVEFIKKVKEVFILGGCIYGKGNYWVLVEFNFGVDFEVVYIFFN